MTDKKTKLFCLEIELPEDEYNRMGFNGKMKCKITDSEGSEFEGKVTGAQFASLECE